MREDKMKRCTKCGVEKPFSEFHKDKRTKTGLRSKCNSCRKECSHRYYQNNREKIAEYYVEYRLREGNKEKAIEYKKKYYEDNKEKIIERAKKYRENNKEKVAERERRYYQDNKGLLTEYKSEYFQNNKEKVAERERRYYQNMPAGIYVIKNTVNDKIYIGCSTMLPQRWRDHKRTLKKGTHNNRYLQKDFEKYGLGAFEFNVIKEYPKDTPFEVLEREETRIILENAKKKTSIYNISIKIRSYIS